MFGISAADWWGSIESWIADHTALLGWLFAISLLSLVLAIVLLPVVVVRLDADYFVASRVELRGHRTVGRWLFLAARNVAGTVFVLVGLALLLLPGQGLVMIFIGLLMLDVPGKRALERRIVRLPKIRQVLDGMRVRRGRPPFRLD
jgi:hypothetical protein